MAHKIVYKPREMVLTPPVGWRKPIPLSVKLQVIIEQRGLAPDKTPLDALSVGVHFDHRPPLHEREYDPVADETVPPANDHRFIVALPTPLHRMISGIDVRRIRKTERQRKAETSFQNALLAKEPGRKRVAKGTICGRGFRKRKE